MATPTTAEIEAAFARADGMSLEAPGEEWRRTKYPDVWISSLGRVAFRKRDASFAVAATYVQDGGVTPRCVVFVDGARIHANVRTMMREAFFPNETERLATIGDPGDMRLVNLRPREPRVARAQFVVVEDETCRANLERLRRLPRMTYQQFAAAYEADPMSHVVRRTTTNLSVAVRVRMNYVAYERSM